MDIEVVVKCEKRDFTLQVSLWLLLPQWVPRLPSVASFLWPLYLNDAVCLTIYMGKPVGSQFGQMVDKFKTGKFRPEITFTI